MRGRKTYRVPGRGMRGRETARFTAKKIEKIKHRFENKRKTVADPEPDIPVEASLPLHSQECEVVLGSPAAVLLSDTLYNHDLSNECQYKKVGCVSSNVYIRC